MQKVHGPALETPVNARHGQAKLGALVVGLTLLLVLYAMI